MKIFEWLRIKNGIKNNKDTIREYDFSVNGSIDGKYTIYSYKFHHQNYRDLREFKTPQYETGYLFRNKKGFNTYGCNIKYDVIVASVKGKVIDLRQEVEQGFTSRYYANGFYVLFTPAGSINYFNLRKRDVISFKSRKNLY